MNLKLRPYRGEEDWEVISALIQSDPLFAHSVDFPWRSRTLHAPLYNPAFDFVVNAPDGRLAGFCVWWYQPRAKVAQIEPLGVHPDFQQVGLSQALMLYGFRQLAAAGAESAKVETYRFSQGAIRAYEAAGFQATGKLLKYYKEY